MGYYEEAQHVADVFGKPVGIYPTGCDDGRFRHWDWMGPNAEGILRPGYVDIVRPRKTGMNNMPKEWAIVATAPKGTSMVVSCHPTEDAAEQERNRLTIQKPAWVYHVEAVVDESVS